MAFQVSRLQKWSKSNYLVLRKVSRLQYLVLCLNFDLPARASVQQREALTSSRVTPDSLLPFVHPLLSQVYIYIYYTYTLDWH